MTKRVRVYSNDREKPLLTLSCVADVKVALNLTPHVANFGQVERNSEAQTRTISIKAGDGGPINPKIAPTGNQNIETDLREIKAGEEYALDVKIKPPWPNGMLRGRVQIDTGVAKSPQEFITVFARVAQRLSASPSRFNIPPQLTRDLTMRSRLRWSSGAPGKVTKVEINDPELKVDITGDPGQETVELHVPQTYSTDQMKRLTIKVHTDDPEVPVLDIPVFATRARVNAQPAIRARTRSPAVERRSIGIQRGEVPPRGRSDAPQRPSPSGDADQQQGAGE